jgi:hypothetical protein
MLDVPAPVTLDSNVQLPDGSRGGYVLTFINQGITGRCQYILL